MFLTGRRPISMHPLLTGALKMLSTRVNASGRFGPCLMDSSAIHELDLNTHPMVVETRQLLSEG
jgi:hypothetical protein